MSLNTLDTLIAQLSAWAASVHGHLIDRDAAYGAQCWDIAADWAERTGCPIHLFWTLWAPDSADHTLASSMWLYWPVKPGIEEHFTRHGRDEAIRAGDIPIWARSWNFPSSHIAVALGPAGPGGIPCMTQNPGAAQRQTITTAGLLGFLRPITEEDDMYSEADRSRDQTAAKQTAEIHWMLDKRIRPQLDKLEGITNGPDWGVRHLIGQTREELADVRGLVGELVGIKDDHTEHTAPKP